MKRKTPSRCAGAFFIATFAGPEGKGAVCGSRGALAGRKTSPPRAGRFCVATFAGSGGKGHYLGGKSRPRSTRGVFAWRHLTGRAAKGAERGGRYTLADRKTSPQRCGGVLRDNILRAERQRALPAAFDALSRKEKRIRSSAGTFLRGDICRVGGQKALSAAVDTLSRTEKRPRSDAGAFCVTTFSGQNGKARCPQRSGALAGGKTSPRQPHRSLRQKKHPTARGNAFSACPALMGGATQPAALRSHLRRGACSAPSAAISSPAPTRGAEGFSVSRASMHRPPKTQMASRR